MTIDKDDALGCLMARGKPRTQAVVAVARELLGFVWAIGVQVEKESKLAVIAQPLASQTDTGRRAAARPGSRSKISLPPRRRRMALNAPSIPG